MELTPLMMSKGLKKSWTQSRTYLLRQMLSLSFISLKSSAFGFVQCQINKLNGFHQSPKFRYIQVSRIILDTPPHPRWLA